MPGNSKQVRQALADTPRTKRGISPRDFEWKPNQNGSRTRIARLRADVVHKILGREAGNRLEVAVPAYENLGTTNGSADDTESFGVTHGIMDSPNTDAVVIWLDGDYYGQPDNGDYVSTDSVDVTDPGTGSTVHAFYIPEKAATLEIEKAIEGSTSKRQNLKTISLKNTHRTNLSEQPQFFEFTDPEDEFEGFLAGDMTLDVYLNAPFIARYTDPDGDGAKATNALLNFSTLQGQQRVPGFKGLVKAEM